MKKIGWKFPANGGGSEEGFNNPGIEIYSGQPMVHLAREVIQNSIDARKPGCKDPVKVSFILESIDTGKFPGYEEFLKTIKRCSDTTKDERKARKFFENAHESLKNKKIKVLKISDTNTTGLQDGTGSNHRVGQWHNLIKSSGISSKDSDTAGGSFGIGKHAPFALSGLRTVFYSTRYTQGDKTYEYAQGKAILVSHDLPKGGLSQATGFYGYKKGCERLHGKGIPDILRRSDRDGTGTTLFIPSVTESSIWKNQIIAAVISNYFPAIHDGTLEVDVGKGQGKVVINSDTLSDLLDDKDIQGIESANVTEANQYHSAMVDGELFDTTLNILGHCRLWVKMADGYSKKVAILRNGMLVTDSQSKLRRWGNYTDFVAVFVCENKKGNALLRNMENPSHNSFEPKRYEDSKKGKKALDEMTKWIRQKIQQTAEKPMNNIVLLDDMRDFFPAPDDDLPGDSKEKDLEGKVVVIHRPRKVVMRRRQFEDNGTPGRKRGVKSPKDTPPPHSEHTESTDEKRSEIGIRVFRILENINHTDKKIKFIPKESSEKASLSLHISGDSFEEQLKIKEVIEGDHTEIDNKGNVILPITKDKPHILTVRISKKFNRSLLLELTKRENDS